MTSVSLRRPAPILCDLDGVVWLAHRPIPGSIEAIAELRRRGHRIVFVTNNSNPRRTEHVAALGAVGVPDAEVLTSAMAAALLVTAGQRVLVAGGPGIVEAVEARGGVVVEEAPADVVVVGFHRHFDYEGLRRAATAVRGGATLVGANEDATYPTPDGPIPGGGSILAAVATASGTVPIVAGKPHEPMARLVAETLGEPNRRRWSDVWMVGDRAATDGRFARALGCRYAQVRTGVAGGDEAPGQQPELRPDEQASCLADLVPVLSDTLSPWLPRHRTTS